MGNKCGFAANHSLNELGLVPSNTERSVVTIGVQSTPSFVLVVVASERIECLNTAWAGTTWPRWPTEETLLASTSQKVTVEAVVFFDVYILHRYQPINTDIIKPWYGLSLAYDALSLCSVLGGRVVQDCMFSLPSSLAMQPTLQIRNPMPVCAFRVPKLCVPAQSIMVLAVPLAGNAPWILLAQLLYVYQTRVTERHTVRTSKGWRCFANGYESEIADFYRVQCFHYVVVVKLEILYISIHRCYNVAIWLTSCACSILRGLQDGVFLSWIPQCFKIKER